MCVCVFVSARGARQTVNIHTHAHKKTNRAYTALRTVPDDGGGGADAGELATALRFLIQAMALRGLAASAGGACCCGW